MTDTRTTKEKLEAEAETEARVKAEAARAFLAGKLEQWKQDHDGGASPEDFVRSLAETLKTALRDGHLAGVEPSSAPVGIIVGALELLENILPR